MNKERGAFGPEGTDFIKQEMEADTEAREGKICPRCGSEMGRFTLKGGIEKWSCPKDGFEIRNEEGVDKQAA